MLFYGIFDNPNNVVNRNTGSLHELDASSLHSHQNSLSNDLKI